MTNLKNIASINLANSQQKAEELYTYFVNNPNAKTKEEYFLAQDDVMKKLNILVEIIEGMGVKND